MTPAIVVDHVSKRFKIPLDHSTTLKYRALHPRRTSRYRILDAVNDASFEVTPGEFLGITGPNGCGKSTLLKILANIYRPDRGHVHVDGAISPFLELGVGFNPELTARQNIFLGGSLIGMTRGELRDRVDGILDFAELRDFADQKIKNFSSGMQVRLAFSVAIQADAEILLMDEVLAVGDARFQEKCFDIFAQYKRDGRTVVLVTHDLSALDRYCDRVLLMTGGKIIRNGKPAEVTASYRRMVSVRVGEEETAAEVATERWGTREVEITSVRVVGDTILSGDPVSVEVDYLVNSSIDEFACELIVRRDDGVEIAKVSSRADAYRLPGPPPGTSGTLKYSIPQVSLLAGHYLLSCALTDGNLAHQYDRIEKVADLRVTDDRGRAGIVALNGSWYDSVVNSEPGSRLRQITAP